MSDTRGDDYTRRLRVKQDALWKRVLNVQAPYQWNIRRTNLGRTLEIGCGIGRNLPTLPPGSVGVDHNAASVEVARSRGSVALTTEEWATSDLRVPESFDGLLMAHVIEHLPPDEGEAVLRSYLPYLRPGGKVLLICPQERGYFSEPSHVRWTTGEDLEELCRSLGLEPQPWRSFPFPRWAGKTFIYNEFNVVAIKPA